MAAAFSFQLASDLHIEHYDDPSEVTSATFLEPSSPILVIAGDCGCASDKVFATFLKDVASKFQHVLLVAGNHEFYQHHASRKRKSLQEVAQLIQQQTSAIPGVTFLDCSSIVIENTRFIGCTLWSDVPLNCVEYVGTMNDFDKCYMPNEKYPQTSKSRVRKLRIADTVAMHKKHVDFIKRQAQ